MSMKRAEYFKEYYLKKNNYREFQISLNMDIKDN